MLAAGHPSSPDSREALEELCSRYWRPLYFYARRRVSDLHEAQDLVQDFFSRLLEKNIVADADPERGRFRTFLRTAFKHFLANEWKKGRRHKRGGHVRHFSLDFASAESSRCFHPEEKATPESIFDRDWAVTLIDLVLSRLRREFLDAGKETQFEHFKIFLSGRPQAKSYTLAAESLGLAEGAVRTAIHRFRRRYRELLREEITQTVVEPDEIEDEIRSLFLALGS